MAERLRRADAEAWGDETGEEDAESSQMVSRSASDERPLVTRSPQCPPRAALAPLTSAALPPDCSVPTLRALCLGFLGRHVESVVAQLGPHLAPLPADVKACLLCVARRRGVLSNRVLLALADDGLTLLDLAGAATLSERAVRQALLRCPHLRALDLTGLSALSAALLRDLPALCPALELLVVGGSKALEAALLEVLPDVLPRMLVRDPTQEAVTDSWEEVAAGDGIQLPDPGIPCGIQRLKVLVWPQAPALVRHIIASVSPRVDLANSLPPFPAAQPSMPLPQPPQDIGYEGSRAPASSSPRASNVRAAEGFKEPSPLGSSAAVSGGGGGAAARGGINVLRVRQPSGHGHDGTASESLQLTSSASAAQWSAAGARYLAPHLRRRQQSPQDGWGEQRLQGGPPEGCAGGGVAPTARMSAPAALHPREPALLQRSLRDLHYQLAPVAVHPLPPSARAPDAAAPSGPVSWVQQRGAHHAGPQRQSQRQPQPQLDDCLACLVSDEAWEGMGVPGSEAQAVAELHIAEKFRLAYVEQDARLRNKAKREAAAAERYELRTSGTARALAQWLDAE